VSEVIDDLVSQYAEETAFLWSRRHDVTHAAHYRLSDLAQADERLAAHIEGLHVSGICGWHYCEKGLERQEPGDVFAAAVVALETCDPDRIEKVLDAVDRAPQTISGVTSAFGWVDPVALRVTVHGLLRSQSSLRRHIGVTACAMHRVDPGLMSSRRLEDPSPLVRARAMRTAGELGQAELLSTCISALLDKDPQCQFWSEWSSVLLGNRDQALDALSRTSIDLGALTTRAFRLALQAMSVTAAHRWLKSLVADPPKLRWLIQGSGIAGDPTYIPWLTEHMRNEKVARLAAEAFSLITGADLGESRLEGKPPASFEPGPNDDPNDNNVDMDPDDGLPWPDPVKIQKWWDANKHRFQPGVRYFVGGQVTREHCIDVLKNGYQRHRILAAHYLCLLEPGTPLFNTSAPAWRQQRCLAKMG
jgi:uncharacterized protein (TIGR02270 family)